MRYEKTHYTQEYLDPSGPPVCENCPAARTAVPLYTAVSIAASSVRHSISVLCCCNGKDKSTRFPCGPAAHAADCCHSPCQQSADWDSVWTALGPDAVRRSGLSFFRSGCLCSGTPNPSGFPKEYLGRRPPPSTLFPCGVWSFRHSCPFLAGAKLPRQMLQTSPVSPFRPISPERLTKPRARCLVLPNLEAASSRGKGCTVLYCTVLYCTVWVDRPMGHRFARSRGSPQRPCDCPPKACLCVWIS